MPECRTLESPAGVVSFLLAAKCKPMISRTPHQCSFEGWVEATETHRCPPFRSQGLVTVCVKPGFVRTGMTEGLKEPPFACDPDEVASLVVRAIDEGTPVVYAPAMWRAVMAAIKAMPRFVMRRVKF